jgi:hypothetical protein
VKDARERIGWLLLAASLVRPRLPAVVTITRLGPRLMDCDNNVGACKPARDAVAAYLGCDDGPRGPVRWVCDQRVAADYGVEIEVRSGAVAPSR